MNTLSLSKEPSEKTRSIIAMQKLYKGFEIQITSGHRSDGWQASVTITPAVGDVGFIEPGKIYSSQEEAETDALKTAENYIDQAVR